MKDRIPTDPGRVKLTRADGSSEYVHLERADAPTEEGTPLNKETLLQDATAALYGLDDRAVVDDVLQLLGLTSPLVYLFRVTVTLPDGTPAAGVTVSGLTALTSTAGVKTDSTGVAVGKSPSKTTTVSAGSSYIDLNGASKTVTAAGVLTDVALAYTSASGRTKTYTSSFSGAFSPAVKTVTYEVIGGGGSGGASMPGSYGVYAGGGGGGFITRGTTSLGSARTVSGTIGSGGAAAVVTGMSTKNGAAGGSTVLTLGGTAYTAAGGSGGAGDSRQFSARAAGGGQGGAADANGATVNGLVNSVDAAYAGGGGGLSEYDHEDTRYNNVGKGAGGGGNAYNAGASGSSTVTYHGYGGTSYGAGGGGIGAGYGKNVTINSGAGKAGAIILSWTY